MFKIIQEDKQYKTYIISNSSSRLEIVPERGGIVTNWQVENNDILYLDRERFADPNLSIRGGIPILFPICGNLPNNIFTYNNSEYNLKQHGFARDLPWQIEKETVNNDSANLSLILKSNQQTLSVYPFEFEVIFTYKFTGKSLRIEQTYTNKSQVKMPFSTGLHPYFCVTDKSQLEFNIPSHQYQDQKTKSVHTWQGQFDFNQNEIDAGFMSLNGNSTSMIDKARGLELTINFSDSYSTVVFWTLKGQDYVCLEPWTAPRNSLNTGVGLIYIDPETTLHTWVEMSIKKT